MELRLWQLGDIKKAITWGARPEIGAESVHLPPRQDLRAGRNLRASFACSMSPIIHGYVCGYGYDYEDSMDDVNSVASSDNVNSVDNVNSANSANNAIFLPAAPLR